MKVLKLAVKLNAYVDGDHSQDEALDLVANSLEIFSTSDNVEIDVETIEITKNEEE